MTEISSIEKFQHIVERAGGFLYSNRYTISISKLNGEQYQAFANRVELPQRDITLVDAEIGGKQIHVPGKYVLGDLQITFFDTGKEFFEIYKLLSTIYNDSTRCFQYYEDAAMDIVVEEFDKANHTRLKHKFTGCILKSLAGLNLSYAETADPRSFMAAFACNTAEIEYFKPKNTSDYVEKKMNYISNH